MGASAKTIRVQFYVDKDIRNDFYKAIFDKFGKTSGGAVSEAGTEAIRLWIKLTKGEGI
jgi:hypothetical protein